MKKSLLTLAVIAAVGLTQAASLNWTITNVPNASEGFTAMLFLTQQSSSAEGFENFGKASTTIAKVTELADAGDYSSLAALAGANIDYTGNVSNKATGYNGNDFGAGDSLTGFALILDKEKKNYFLTAERSQSFTSSLSSKALSFGSQSGATYKSFGVPEPATGALALAGVALLFRRRRA